MSALVTLGQVPWARSDMLERLEEFSRLYDARPIKDNRGGMRSPHMFLAWFVLQALKPKAIIESGVWLGQGTWLFERACPDARLYCIDLNLSRIQYRSARADYFDQDFSTIDWSHLPRDETLLFFDDHQDAYERVKTARWFGFRHLIFEDNYAPSQGDCYSLKKVFSHSGFRSSSSSPSLKSKLRRKAQAILGMTNRGAPDIPPNEVDARYLRENLEVYCELPPIFKTERTRWGDLWNDEHYPTPEPLLSRIEREYQRQYLDEAIHYTWMCYAKLR